MKGLNIHYVPRECNALADALSKDGHGVRLYYHLTGALKKTWMIDKMGLYSYKP